ncbi:hypothetical protein V2J09_005239 [Rumex salicifolius]
MRPTTPPSYATVFCVFVIGTWVLLLLISSTMAEKSSPSESSGVYIIYTEKPDGEAETHHLQTLSTVIGSEDAAKEALLYTYTTAATGFSAKLTAEQAEEMSRIEHAHQLFTVNGPQFTDLVLFNDQ